MELDISHTTITYFTTVFFAGVRNVEVLHLSNLCVDIYNLGKIYILEGFSNINTLFVYHESMCCIVSNVQCIPDIKRKDIFATCGEIISSKFLYAYALFVAVTSICLNGISIVWNAKRKSSNLANLLLPCSLNIADGLMFVYLTILMIAHYIYQSDIAYVVFRWKQSVTCRLCGVIIMTSTTAGNLATMLIAVDRYICCVWKPFQRYGFLSLQSIAWISVSWGFSIIVPVLATTVGKREITNSACITLGGSISLPYSIIYAAANLFIFTSILLLYSSITYTVYKSDQVQKMQQKFKNVAGRLGIVITTNFLASMTITIFSILSLILYVPASLEAMLAFVLFTLNSCINPIVNTISTQAFVANLMKSDKLKVLP